MSTQTQLLFSFLVTCDKSILQIQDPRVQPNCVQTGTLAKVVSQLDVTQPTVSNN